MAWIRFAKAVALPRQAALGLDWEETEHPRDVTGKFTGKPGPRPGQAKAGRPPVRAVDAPRPAAMAKPTVRFGRDDLRFSAADEAHAPLTVMVKKIAAATGLFEPMALWALSERDVARLREECERNDDEVGMMMVDVHRNMRRALSPAEVADAREVVVTLLGQARARQRKLGKAVLRLRKGPRSFKFDEVAHPRHPKGHPKGGQFRPKYASTVTLADFRLPETLGYL
ncbi:MAG TPA: hypothetical protein PKI52_15590, partial [Aggregatilineales bacterium]|nr:hypothetical protein [Aggregatilineales bacterium]